MYIYILILTADCASILFRKIWKIYVEKCRIEIFNIKKGKNIYQILYNFIKILIL
jgi:hypothetical protein